MAAKAFTFAPVSDTKPTGWLKLQSVAFLTPRKEVVVVVLNEAGHSVDFDIKNGDDDMRTSIPAHAMQTYFL